MSTTFAIFKIPIETDLNGSIISDYSEDDYIEVAFRSSNGIYWLNNLDKLEYALIDDFKVYPLDNSAQGIYTVGDLKKEINLII